MVQVWSNNGGYVVQMRCHCSAAEVPLWCIQRWRNYSETLIQLWDSINSITVVVQLCNLCLIYAFAVLGHAHIAVEQLLSCMEHLLTFSCLR